MWVELILQWMQELLEECDGLIDVLYCECQFLFIVYCQFVEIWFVVEKDRELVECDIVILCELCEEMIGYFCLMVNEMLKLQGVEM